MTVYTRQEMLAAGLRRHEYEGPEFRRLLHGTYTTSDTKLTQRLWVEAATRVLPGDMVVTGMTALRLMGLDLGTDLPITVATSARIRRRGVKAIRRRPDHEPPIAAPLTAAMDALIGCGLRMQVEIWDRLLFRKVLSAEDSEHLAKLPSLKKPGRLVRPGAESPAESRLRLAVMSAGLPAPECQHSVAVTGRWVGRVDMAWLEHQVILEYEGLQHATDPQQWNKDISRYERLAEAGWTVVRVTAEHLREPDRVVMRVHEALRSRGYRGPAPRLDGSWWASVA